MKFKLACLLIFIIINVACFSQEYKYVYYLDKNLVSTKEENALLIGKGKKEERNFKLDCFNKLSNALLMTIHYSDSSLAEMNGSFKSFYENGRLENSGQYLNNLEEGIWIKNDTSGFMIDSSKYEKGIKLYHANYTYYKSKKIYSYEFTDTLKNTYQYLSYDSLGKIKDEANFIGNNGTYNKYNDDKKIESVEVFTRALIEAECKGYMKHLSKTLKADVPVNNKAKPGRYNVIVKFIIGENGDIVDIIPETHLGFGMEEEVIRVIRKSPRWSPASMFGIKVKSVKRQPITFMVSQDQ
jgi:antitoxin component YwqK of YwqJK toxin-antitoxin module